MSPPPPATIEALARQHQARAFADAALALALATFVFVCLFLADHSAVERWGVPAAPADPDPPTGTQVAMLPGTDLGTPVLEAGHADPPPASENDLQRRIGEIRRGLENAVSGREINEMQYISLSAAMSMVEGECRWDRAGRVALGISAEGLAHFTPDASTVDFNGDALGMSGPAKRVDADLYVPVRAMAELYGAKLTRDPDSELLVVESHGKRFPVVSEQVFRMEICRSERWLRVFYAGKLAKEYPICSGAGDNTPVGHFHIENKAEWPSWRAYWGEYMEGGSARNPLGARWLGTTARGRVTGWPIGVHGTNDPSSIGQRISGGCIRTYNENAIELYDTIPIGTPVWIHE